MKEIGIVRKIDELGRIVIPKEIRNTLHIKNGDTLELFVENNLICLKKYSMVNSLKEKASFFIEAFQNAFFMDLLLFDLEVVVSSSIPKFNGRKYPIKFLSFLEKREKYRSSSEEEWFEGLKGYYLFSPIFKNGELFGSVLLFSKNLISDDYYSLINFLSNLLFLE
ncbi:MAG: AbrB/MazE/SpoVT family DNA-binding domain-containing protein [Bacilli bacterium]|nr:AbrB/MazE/SpoVT family DNA-binding domain-containing protein [Bacilli bacterium]